MARSVSLSVRSWPVAARLGYRISRLLSDLARDRLIVRRGRRIRVLSEVLWIAATASQRMS